jgi:16S rRNA (cytidine1402-2'-O)-methyltransferase
MKPDGQLILVATPIGNLGDISRRAAETLEQADVVYCEDTRHTRQLLSHLAISGQKLVSLHEHNEASRIQQVIDQLEAGQQIALASDAGTPVISDPGQRLVAAVRAAGHTVTAIPGPNAALMALAISGLPAEQFVFEGFLPSSGKARKERLAAIATEYRTAILYESPHRLTRTVVDLAAVINSDRIIILARELTKLHEEVWRGTAGETLIHVDATPPRGEYTLVIEGANPVDVEVSDSDIEAALRSQLEAGVSSRTAIDAVAKQYQLPRKRIYALSLKLK